MSGQLLWSNEGADSSLLASPANVKDCGSVAEVVIAAEGRGRRLAQGGAIAAAALLETHGQGQKSSSGASLAEALDLASEGYGVADDLEALLLAYARQQVRISVN